MGNSRSLASQDVGFFHSAVTGDGQNSRGEIKRIRLSSGQDFYFVELAVLSATPPDSRYCGVSVQPLSESDANREPMLRIPRQFACNGTFYEYDGGIIELRPANRPPERKQCIEESTLHSNFLFPFQFTTESVWLKVTANSIEYVTGCVERER